MLTVNGILNWATNEVYPTDTGKWSDLVTWDNFTNWYTNPTLPMTWLTPPIELEVANDFNLKIETSAQGQTSYEVYSSVTGAFDGEETTTVIAAGATNVSGFYGRFVRVGVKLSATNGVTRLKEVLLTATNKPISEIITNVDTSTLDGTSSARTIPITRNYSIISDISINVRQVTAYNLDMYVTNYPSCTTVIPRVVSKIRSAPTIACIGLDKISRDATVDITVTGLPEQYMSGNNLLTR